MSSYILITESALDVALMSNTFSVESMLPVPGGGLFQLDVQGSFKAYRVANEPLSPYFALVGLHWLERLKAEGAHPADVFQRIARVVKGLKSPPVHLPRLWSEYHYKNLLAFFATPRDTSNTRWIVELSSSSRCARFDYLSFGGDEITLAGFNADEWPPNLSSAIVDLLERQFSAFDNKASDHLSQQVDLVAIGSSSVVGEYSFEQWEQRLNGTQKAILSADINTSIRIVGPAGSGKTLTLCMRALQLSRSEQVSTQGLRILIATHSWAMSERIDGILSILNSGSPPASITVFPLLSLLQLHTGYVGQSRIDVIGDDSTDGRVRSLEIISSLILRADASRYPNISEWIRAALKSNSSDDTNVDLTINLYEEISGVLTASGVSPDDAESIQKYINSSREDWMPPFVSAIDRSFVIDIYKQFIQQLIDRAAVTTDQFILDSIRVLETFAWRMRRETEGYDYIFVDELQLFDPQERSALELLGRSRKGVPFVTAEDPSQGVFSALNGRRSGVDNEAVYLETVHRFNREIFDFISFVYRQFPLNALPLQIDRSSGNGKGRPALTQCETDTLAVQTAAARANEVWRRSGSEERLCIVTIGDVTADLLSQLEKNRLNYTKLSSFDDVEQLSYRRKSVVVSPWQFIGGTQFSHVIVLVSGVKAPTSQFSKLREMISVYLSCSRATTSLDIVCSSYVPEILSRARESGLLA